MKEKAKERKRGERARIVVAVVEVAGTEETPELDRESWQLERRVTRYVPASRPMAMPGVGTDCPVGTRYHCTITAINCPVLVFYPYISWYSIRMLCINAYLLVARYRDRQERDN